MIEARVTLDGVSLLRSVEMRGHAGAGKRGEDIVCAAVSALTRTAASVLEGRAYIETEVIAPERGVFCLYVNYKREGEPYLSAIQDFLLAGLRSVAGEYPECLKLDIDAPRGVAGRNNRLRCPAEGGAGSP